MVQRGKSDFQEDLPLYVPPTAAGYSWRKTLRVGYTGPVMELQRGAAFDRKGRAGRSCSARAALWGYPFKAPLSRR